MSAKIRIENLNENKETALVTIYDRQGNAVPGSVWKIRPGDRYESTVPDGGKIVAELVRVRS